MNASNVNQIIITTPIVTEEKPPFVLPEVSDVDHDGSYGSSSSSSSSPQSAHDGPRADLSTNSITAQLAASGTVGVAAAAAIASSSRRRRKLPHRYSFETNPMKRRRVKRVLMRKLENTVNELTVRVGQQAIVLFTTPGQPRQDKDFKVFGSQPLVNVVSIECKISF